MLMRSLLSLTILALTATVLTLPTPTSLGSRTDITLPGGTDIDTGDDIGDLSEFSPIEDGFLEGDSDTGGGSGNIGEVDGAIANGLGSVGAVSGSTSKDGSGSTSSSCSITGCTSAAQASNGNNTSTETSNSGLFSGLTPRAEVTLPGGAGIDTGDLDLGDISPIEDGTLEGDSDTGGGSDNIGEVDGAIANGLGSVGSVSGSTSKDGSGSTSSACSLTGCTSAAQSSNGNSTQTTTASSGLINSPIIEGPIVEGPIIG